MSVSVLWLILAVLHILIGIMPWRSSFDIQVHDTYFIVAPLHLFGLIAFFYVGLYGFYKLLGYYSVLPNTFLQILQAVGFIYFNVLLLNILLPSISKRYYAFHTYPITYYTIHFYIFIFIQILFVLDILRKSLLR